MTHLTIEGEFQSDEYPTCPRGKVPLSCADPTAQDLLWAYAQRRRAVDAEFADDLEEALRLKGYDGDETLDEVAAELEAQTDASTALLHQAAELRRELAEAQRNGDAYRELFVLFVRMLEAEGFEGEQPADFAAGIQRIKRQRDEAIGELAAARAAQGTLAGGLNEAMAERSLLAKERDAANEAIARIASLLGAGVGTTWPEARASVLTAVAELKRERDAAIRVAKPERFGVLWGANDVASEANDVPRSVAWEHVEAHEAQAYENHGLTLAELAAHGGLDPWELLALVTDKGIRSVASRSLTQVVAKLRALGVFGGPCSCDNPKRPVYVSCGACGRRLDEQDPRLWRALHADGEHLTALVQALEESEAAAEDDRGAWPTPRRMAADKRLDIANLAARRHLGHGALDAAEARIRAELAAAGAVCSTCGAIATHAHRRLGDAGEEVVLRCDSCWRGSDTKDASDG